MAAHAGRTMPACGAPLEGRPHDVTERRVRLGSTILLFTALLATACGGEITPPSAALPPEAEALIRALVEEKDHAAREAAHQKLPDYGTAIVKPLADALDRPDVDDGIGAWIAETLGALGPEAKDAAPALGRRLMTGGDCSATTSWALEMIGPPGLPHLVKAVAQGPPPARLWATRAVSNLAEEMGKEAAAALPALSAALGDPEAEVRANASYALGYLGIPDAGASERLRKLLDDPSPEVVPAAYEAVLRLGLFDDAAAERARALFARPDEERASMCDQVLVAFDAHLEDDAIAVPLLRLGLEPREGRNAWVRRVAIGLLLGRQVDDADLVAEYAAGPARDDDPEDWLDRAEVLVEAGPNGRAAAVPLLARVLELSPSTENRVQAAGALVAAATEPASREAALRALRAHGEDEPEVAEAIREALEDLEAGD